MRLDEKKAARRLRRKRHIRRKSVGSAEKPRLSVFRSHQNISCQLIDDRRGVTLAASSTLSKEVRALLQGKGGNRQAASAVGKDIAEKAKGLGIAGICFDRNGYRFHGRVKALADAARAAGLKF
jgi:large subunit ribosomal protein L18